MEDEKPSSRVEPQTLMEPKEDIQELARNAKPVR